MLSEGRIVRIDTPEGITGSSEEFQRLFNLASDRTESVPEDEANDDVSSPERRREA
jgi:hypothetical protein